MKRMRPLYPLPSPRPLSVAKKCTTALPSTTPETPATCISQFAHNETLDQLFKISADMKLALTDVGATNPLE